MRYDARLTDVGRLTPGGALLVATTNPGKIREIRRDPRRPARQAPDAARLPPIPAPEETGRTFAANAALKARAYATASGLPTVAEDSGLAIDALGGRPGVESARYPGRDLSRALREPVSRARPSPRPWTARFVCSLAFVPMRVATGGAVRHRGHRRGRNRPSAARRERLRLRPDFLLSAVSATLGEVDRSASWRRAPGQGVQGVQRLAGLAA